MRVLQIAIIFLALIIGGVVMVIPSSFLLLWLEETYKDHAIIQALHEYANTQLAEASETQQMIVTVSILSLIGTILAALMGWLTTTGFGIWWLGVLNNWAPYKGRDAAELECLAAQVAERMGFDGKLTFLYPKKEQGIAAVALGKGTIVLSKNLFALPQSEELKAILAHEIAHLKSRDSAKTLFVYGCLGSAYLVVWLLLRAFRLVGILITILPGGFIVWRVVEGVIALLFEIARRILSMMLRVLNYGDDYRADAAVAEAGYGEQLISILHRLRKLELPRAQGLHGMLWRLQPAEDRRIARLREMVGDARFIAAEMSEA